MTSKEQNKIGCDDLNRLESLKRTKLCLESKLDHYAKSFAVLPKVLRRELGEEYSIHELDEFNKDDFDLVVQGQKYPLVSIDAVADLLKNYRQVGVEIHEISRRLRRLFPNIFEV